MCLILGETRLHPLVYHHFLYQNCHLGLYTIFRHTIISFDRPQKNGKILFKKCVWYKTTEPFFCSIDLKIGNGGSVSIVTIWLFNIAMGKSQFLIGKLGKPSINGPLSMAMLNNQRVLFVLPGPQASLSGPTGWRGSRGCGPSLGCASQPGLESRGRPKAPSHQVQNRPGNMFVSRKRAPWHPDPLSILGKQPAKAVNIESDVVENTTTTSWIPTWCPSWLYHCAKRESQSQALNCWSLRLEGSIIREL